VPVCRIIALPLPLPLPNRPVSPHLCQIAPHDAGPHSSQLHLTWHHRTARSPTPHLVMHDRGPWAFDVGLLIRGGPCRKWAGGEVCIYIHIPPTYPQFFSFSPFHFHTSVVKLRRTKYQKKNFRKSNERQTVWTGIVRSGPEQEPMLGMGISKRGGERTPKTYWLTVQFTSISTAPYQMGYLFVISATTRRALTLNT